MRHSSDSEDVPKAAIPETEWARYGRELGQNLHRLRIAAGMSQEDVAYNAGVSRHTYYRLEKGIARTGSPANPSLQNVIAIASALNSPLVELLPTWVPAPKP